MSTYHFKANTNNKGSLDAAQQTLDQLKDDKEIERWSTSGEGAEQVLTVETNKLTPDIVKHQLRAAGYDVDFALAPGSQRS